LYLKMNAHVEEPVPPIRGCRADVPEQLATALERMLAKDRADRFRQRCRRHRGLAAFYSGADLVGLSLAAPPSAIVAA